MAVNMQEIFDKLKEYIDTKIDSVEINLTDLFIEHGIKIVADNIAIVESVSNNIVEIKLVGHNIGPIKVCNDNMSYIKVAPQAAQDAINASNLAVEYRDNAFRWSSESEDTIVDDGVRQGYSAYHWAKKAENYNPDDFLKTDGSNAMSNDFDGGSNKITNIIDGTEATDGATVGQVSDVKDDLTAHVSDTANPHQVSKDQIGLNNVPNLDTTDAVNHVGKTDNPHQVSKEQVGLGNVPNLDTTDAINHVSKIDNPHQVSKEQVGLGNVPNLDTTDAINHIGLTDNPHNVTVPQIGAAWENHGHKIAEVEDLWDRLTDRPLKGEVYLQNEFIDTSTGTTDGGKPIVLNSNGQIDASMIETSSFYPVGAWDPSAGTEYPDPTGESPGAFWYVDKLDNPTDTDPEPHYVFTSGDLDGKSIRVGDFMVWSSTGWGIMVGEMNPALYMKLDKSSHLDNNGQPLVVNGKVTFIEPATANGEAVEYSQLTSHTGATDNQHSVTKAQVGLGSVPDLDTTAAVNHVGLTDNPHAVTAAQTGALPLAGGTLTGNIALQGNDSPGIDFKATGYDDGSYFYRIHMGSGGALNFQRLNSTGLLSTPLQFTNNPRGLKLDGNTLVWGSAFIIFGNAIRK
jgi:hypothetical protein